MAPLFHETPLSQNPLLWIPFMAPLSWSSLHGTPFHGTPLWHSLSQYPPFMELPFMVPPFTEAPFHSTPFMVPTPCGQHNPPWTAPPPCEQNKSQMQKHYLAPNFVCNKCFRNTSYLCNFQVVTDRLPSF